MDVYSVKVTETVTWPTYLRVISDGETGVEIAKHAGVPNSTVSRWLDGSAHPRPRQVVKLAKAYGVHPLQALIAAGYLDAADVDLSAITPRKLQLREFTELEIAEEMVRRVAEGESSMLETPLDGNHPAMQKMQPVRRQRDYALAENPPETPRIRRVRVKKPKDSDE